MLILPHPSTSVSKLTHVAPTTAGSLGLPGDVHSGGIRLHIHQLHLPANNRPTIELVAMASNLLVMASNLIAMDSNLIAMATNLLAMASNLIAMASNLLGTA